MKIAKIFSSAGLILIIGSVLIALLLTRPVQAGTVSDLVTFDTITDLDNYFNPSTPHTFTNVATGGISNTGAVNVPLGSNEIWTTKQGYSVSGAGDIYTFSAFFKIKENSGYGGLGFSKADVNSTDLYGSPVKGIGMVFHGGGGMFVNNRVYTVVDWLPDLVLGNWYKMIFVVTAEGSNTYNLDFQIWNSDAGGNLGSMKTEKTLNGVVNADVGGASIIHGYFSAAGSRMEKIDNFLIELEGGASFIQQGSPVVLTDSVTNITDDSATSGGNVTDEQGSAVTAKGVCWSTSTSPTIADDCTNDGSGLGSFTSNLTGLTPGTIYYIRSYATNSSGTSYGSENTFTTELASTPTPTPTPTPTETPTPTPTPTETPSPTPIPSSSLSSSSAPICNDPEPLNAPDLFQIDVNGYQAKLFYAPVTGNNTDYYINYSLKPNTFLYSTDTGQNTSTGVLSYTINMLNSNTVYYFEVRGQNGCMPGDWSNEMSIKTRGKGTTATVSYYKSILVSFPTITYYKYVKPIGTPQVQGLETTFQPVSVSTPEPTIIPSPSPTKRSCFLWWCW